VKKFILLSAVTLIHISCFTQDNKDAFLLYNKDWSFAKNIESATYFMHKEIVNDTTYICRFYYKNGPLIQMETYRDTGLDLRHGRFAWYNRNGDLDSMGIYYYGKKDKRWEYAYGDSSNIRLMEEYDNGVLKKSMNFLTRTVYWPDGKQESFDQQEQKIHSQAAAQFKDGMKGWINYLTRNLIPPQRFLQLAGERSGRTVIAGFEISKEGMVSEVFIVHSCEWSADMEAIRVIKKSPLWEPAMQNGERVIYRHRQSITYQMR